MEKIIKGTKILRHYDNKDWLNCLRVERLKGNNKRDRGLEGWKDSLLTLISQPSSHPYLYPSKRPAAFTMAEILISLTIIGIIAAITLPSLVGNIKEKSWATQKKALYSRMSQAISMMPSLNGYGVGATEAETKANAAQAFISNGLAKVLQINNICNNQNLKKCGFPDKIKTIDGAYNITTPSSAQGLNFAMAGNYDYVNPNNPTLAYSYSLIDTKAAAFETKNGESILTFYQPYCLSEEMLPANDRRFYPSAPYMCANFVYDLNGRKGPNQVGKDMGFITVLYSVNTEIVAPNFFKKDLSLIDIPRNKHNEAVAACRELNGRLPRLEEGMAMGYNMNFLDIPLQGHYYFLNTSDKAIKLGGNLQISKLNFGGDSRIRCVEK